MNIRTLALTLSAPREAIFNFLADVENLPRWAAGYCERIYLQRGGWWALTSEGELMVDLTAHTAAGVIDLRTGSASERMNFMPIRVLALSSRRTLVSIVVIEAPDQTAEACDRRFAIFREAAQGLLLRFGGGELHLGTPALALPENCLN